MPSKHTKYFFYLWKFEKVTVTEGSEEEAKNGCGFTIFCFEGFPNQLIPNQFPLESWL